jgi:hypothetical protein
MLAALRTQIAARPWQAVATAAAVGAWLALEDRRERRRELVQLARAFLVRTGRRFLDATIVTLAAAGCAGHVRYVYAPAHANRWMDEFHALALPFPPEAPAGRVELASFGVTQLRPANGTPTTNVHVRVIVTNSGDDVWIADTRTALLEVPRVRRTSAMAVGTDAGSRPPTTIGRGERRVFDLFFPMPASVDDARDLVAFDFAWEITTPNGTFPWRTQFTRVDVTPRRQIAIGRHEE